MKSVNKMIREIKDKIKDRVKKDISFKVNIVSSKTLRVYSCGFYNIASDSVFYRTISNVLNIRVFSRECSYSSDGISINFSEVAVNKIFVIT